VPFPVSLIVYNTPATVQAGEVIQAMAAEAGFAVQVNPSYSQHTRDSQTGMVQPTGIA
jgi:hypothetical protein